MEKPVRRKVACVLVSIVVAALALSLQACVSAPTPALTLVKEESPAVYERTVLEKDARYDGKSAIVSVMELKQAILDSSSLSTLIPVANALSQENADLRKEHNAYVRYIKALQFQRTTGSILEIGAGVGAGFFAYWFFHSMGVIK